MRMKINMDKTSEKVTKDPRRVEQGKKSYETRMKRVKEKILKEKEDNRLPTPSTSSPTCGPTSSTSSSACDPSSYHTTRSYVYGVSIHAVLAIGVCVFFAYPKTCQ